MEKATLQSGTRPHCFPNLVHKTAIILEFGIPIRTSRSRQLPATLTSQNGTLLVRSTLPRPTVLALRGWTVVRCPGILMEHGSARPKLKVMGRRTELPPPGRRLPGLTPAGAARSSSCAGGSAAEGLSPRKAPEAEAEATRPTRLNMAESGWRLRTAAVPAAGPAAGAG